MFTRRPFGKIESGVPTQRQQPATRLVEQVLGRRRISFAECTTSYCVRALIATTLHTREVKHTEATIYSRNRGELSGSGGGCTWARRPTGRRCGPALGTAGPAAARGRSAVGCSAPSVHGAAGGVKKERSHHQVLTCRNLMAMLFHRLWSMKVRLPFCKSQHQKLR